MSLNPLIAMLNHLSHRILNDTCSLVNFINLKIEFFFSNTLHTPITKINALEIKFHAEI